MIKVLEAMCNNLPICLKDPWFIVLLVICGVILVFMFFVAFGSQISGDDPGDRF